MNGQSKGRGWKGTLQAAVSAATTASQAYKNLNSLRGAAGIDKPTGKRKRPNNKSRKRKKRIRDSGGIVTMDGDSRFDFKSVKYKLTKLGRVHKWIGSNLNYEQQAFGTVQHIATDPINSQKIQQIIDLYGLGSFQAIFKKAYAGLLVTEPNYNADIIQQYSTNHKFFIDYVNMETEFVNQTQGGCHFTYYVCMSKNTKSSGTTPLTDWTAGLQDDAGQNSAFTDANYIGCTPTQSKIFNENYKIVHRKTLLMGPGARHHFKFKFSPRSLVDAGYINRYTHIKGISYYLFVVQHGQLGVQNAGGVVVAPLPTKVIYNVRTHYRVRLCSAFPDQTYQQRADLGTVGAMGAIAIREDDGEIENA